MPTSKTAEVVRTDAQENALAQISNLMARIPEAGGDGFSMIEDILSVTRAEDLIGDDSSTLPKAEEFFDHDVRVDSLTSASSDFEDISSITDKFLIVKGHDLTTQTDCMFSIGAQSAVVKLAKLHELGALPATVRFSRSPKATRNGYYPVNMAVITVSTTA